MKTAPGNYPQIVERCLRRIAERDGEIRAWVEVVGQAALDAFVCDGPLAGIPFGAKDIFETRGMATEYGSPLYAGRRGETDAAVITELRALGAILLGKTHTTAFASFDAAPTRNPRAPGRTPGGSSAGSAAAVAAGMAPFALGTQTLGSVLRPASYCGVCGFKPSFGRISTEGVLPFAPSLDTVGFFTATAGEMQDLWSRSFGLPLAYARGSDDQPDKARRLGIAYDPSRDREGAVVNWSGRLARQRVAGQEPMAGAEGASPSAPSLDTAGDFSAMPPGRLARLRVAAEEPMARAEGVSPSAPSLDTAGDFPATPPGRLARLRVAAEEPMARAAGASPSVPLLETAGDFTASSPGRIARLRVPAEEPMARAIEDAARRLRTAGMRVDDLDPPDGWQDLIEAAYIINAYEGARTHEPRYRDFGERLGARLAALIRRGLAMPEDEYQSALDRVERMRSVVARLFEEYPAILSPAATGPPPLGFESTGDPSANAAWTALGVPAIGVPLAGPRTGYDIPMPMGMQLTGGWGSDDAVVALAAHAEALLAVEAA